MPAPTGSASTSRQGCIKARVAAPATSALVGDPRYFIDHCYWERQHTFSATGGMRYIEDSGFVFGPTTVRILASDRGFYAGRGLRNLDEDRLSRPLRSGNELLERSRSRLTKADTSGNFASASSQPICSTTSAMYPDGFKFVDGRLAADLHVRDSTSALRSRTSSSVMTDSSTAASSVSASNLSNDGRRLAHGVPPGPCRPTSVGRPRRRRCRILPPLRFRSAALSSATASDSCRTRRS